MKILIVGGRPITTWPSLGTYDYYIGIDRGALHLLEAKIPCDAAIGDFDSLSELEQMKVFEYASLVKQSPPEKDDTDTQLGLLHALTIESTAEITLIGLTGGRIDHFLANLWLPLEPRFRSYCRQFKLVDQQNIITFFEPGHYTISKEPDMRYLAYCCLTPVTDLTLAESKYTLQNVDVMYPLSYASNEFLTDTVSLSFKSGMIAVIQSKD